MEIRHWGARKTQVKRIIHDLGLPYEVKDDDEARLEAKEDLEYGEADAVKVSETLWWK